ncbi:MAG: sugar phosphate isomerase/epimerase family protein [Pseudomonadota bacterium]
MGPERLSLNTATVRTQWGLAECIDGCVRHGIAGISPWRDKLHEMGVTEGARAIREAGLQVSGLCRGGLFTADGAVDARVLDDNRRAVDEAAELGAECLIIVVGGLPDGSKDVVLARELVLEGLAKTLDYAREVGVTLGLEPLHPMYAADRACVNTMRHALDICDTLGEGIGCAVDVYHVWWDPEIEAQIARAGKERIVAFHICDWLVPTRDMLLDRGMMGDGIIDIPRLRGYAEQNGYDGLCEIEVFSAKDWWLRDPDEVLSVAVERGRTAC